MTNSVLREVSGHFKWILRLGDCPSLCKGPWRDDGLVLVTAWNEIGEGCALLPRVLPGNPCDTGFLEALTEKDGDSPATQHPSTSTSSSPSTPHFPSDTRS